MAVKTYSVLEKLVNAVIVHRNRVARAQARVEKLREEYKTAHWSKQREVAGKGFKAKKVLERAEVDLVAAELALKTEEERLRQPGSFLRFA